MRSFAALWGATLTACDLPIDALEALPDALETLPLEVEVALEPPPPSGPSADGPGAEAIRALRRRPVRPPSPREGYDRDEFGPRWSDIDRNGCDQRNDVLARDLRDVEFRPGSRDCVVLRGTLVDPYTATRIGFVRGDRTSSEVQIDHVVALSNAWTTGAQNLDAETREQLANDPLNLLAVDGHSNLSKGDSDASEWLPPNAGVHCAYAARQVAVKDRYDLWVTPAERRALEGILARCPASVLQATWQRLHAPGAARRPG